MAIPSRSPKKMAEPLFLGRDVLATRIGWVGAVGSQSMLVGRDGSAELFIGSGF